MNADELEKHWTRQTDTEVQAALDEIESYDEPARAVIRAEAERRSIESGTPDRQVSNPRESDEAEDTVEARSRLWLYIDLVGFAFMALMGLGWGWPSLMALGSAVSRAGFTLAPLWQSPVQCIWPLAMAALVIYSCRRFARTLRRLQG